MFPMTPEETLRQVTRYQDEQRAQMARERMARAAPPRGATDPAGARRVGFPGSQRPWVAVRKFLCSLDDWWDGFAQSTPVEPEQESQAET
jgi:hypothetical protein